MYSLLILLFMRNFSKTLEVISEALASRQSLRNTKLRGGWSLPCVLSRNLSYGTSLSAAHAPNLLCFVSDDTYILVSVSSSKYYRADAQWISSYKRFSLALQLCNEKLCPIQWVKRVYLLFNVYKEKINERFVVFVFVGMNIFLAPPKPAVPWCMILHTLTSRNWCTVLCQVWEGRTPPSNSKVSGSSILIIAIHPGCCHGLDCLRGFLYTAYIAASDPFNDYFNIFLIYEEDLCVWNLILIILWLSPLISLSFSFWGDKEWWVHNLKELCVNTFFKSPYPDLEWFGDFYIEVTHLLGLSASLSLILIWCSAIPMTTVDFYCLSKIGSILKIIWN